MKSFTSISKYIWNIYESIYMKSIYKSIYMRVYIWNYIWSIYEIFYFYIEVCMKYMLSSVQSLSHVQLFETPWTSVCQASLSITSSWGLHKLMSIGLVMPSNMLNTLLQREHISITTKIKKKYIIYCRLYVTNTHRDYRFTSINIHSLILWFSLIFTFHIHDALEYILFCIWPLSLKNF